MSAAARARESRARPALLIDVVSREAGTLARQPSHSQPHVVPRSAERDQTKALLLNNSHCRHHHRFSLLCHQAFVRDCVVLCWTEARDFPKSRAQTRPLSVQTQVINELSDTSHLLHHFVEHLLDADLGLRTAFYK